MPILAEISPEALKKKKNPVHTDVGGKHDMQTNGHGTKSDKKAEAFIFCELNMALNTNILWLNLPTNAQ